MKRPLDNPLLERFESRFGLPPFDRIEASHFRTAIEYYISEALATIEAIASSPELPSFENTLVPLEEAGRELSVIASLLFNLNSAETSDAIQAAAAEISPLLTRFSNDITLNEALYERVKRVWQDTQRGSLTTEQQRLLDDRYRAFRLGGAGLNEAHRKRFREVSEELSTLSVKFEENLLAETNDFELHLTSEAELEGLPESIRLAAADDARSRGKEGWIFTLHFPSYVPFMQYSAKRELREKIFMAYSTRCFRGNSRDNREIVSRIVNLRLELANLLGYASYADMVLEERMAGSASAVNSFLDELFGRSRPYAEKDYREVESYARSMGHNDSLRRWDWAYYSEMLKRERFEFDDELLRPYFELSRATAATFDLATRLYGVEFSEVKGLPLYHESVRAWEVKESDGEHLALLLTDFHPRSGKSGGAWMTSYREQYRSAGSDSRPIISIVMNFSRPTGDEPALLTHNEVTTLLHEFGHALHGILSKCTYESLSGTNVRRDFVELPSQIMENWAFEKEWLDTWAVHYRTGERISSELMERVKAAFTFNEGYACNRQLGFGFLDMAWHSISETFEGDVDSFEKAATSETELFPAVEGINQSCGFAHLFSGGYAAGYYGYKWAEVLDADAFSLFLERGIFDSETANSFRRNILEKGGSDDPMKLYTGFRGKEPDIDALLRRSGFTGTI